MDQSNERLPPATHWRKNKKKKSNFPKSTQLGSLSFIKDVRTYYTHIPCGPWNIITSNVCFDIFQFLYGMYLNYRIYHQRNWNRKELCRVGCSSHGIRGFFFLENEAYSSCTKLPLKTCTLRWNSMIKLGVETVLTYFGTSLSHMHDSYVRTHFNKTNLTSFI